MKNSDQRRITQHKRFVPNGTRPNFCFTKTSFMLSPLYDIGVLNKKIGG